jgi:hypothetical protein
MSRGVFLRYGHSSQQRLGVLKAWVALLDSQRRSATSELMDRRVKALLLKEPLQRKSTGKGKRQFPNNMAESLLSQVDAPSLLFTITEKKVHRVRDWGRLFGLSGNGNQITERGLLLQHLTGKEQLDLIRKGEWQRVNPFFLSLKEKLFFLYMLLELDGVWPYLLKRTAEIQDNIEITGKLADTITAQAFLDLVAISQPRIFQGDILRLRDLKELAATMASSLGINDSRVGTMLGYRRRPRRTSPRIRSGVLQPRVNTADDQAIPRFENLVDLGFLTKESPTEVASADSTSLRDRRLEWRYFVTPLLRRWIAAADTLDYGACFLWRRFASCASATFGHNVNRFVSPTEDLAGFLDLLQSQYTTIHRQIGHTPVESIALTMMISGVDQGVICEMDTVHKFFLSLKQEGKFSEYVGFASGNDLDRMFVDIRPGFFEAARSSYGC